MCNYTESPAIIAYQAKEIVIENGLATTPLNQEHSF